MGPPAVISRTVLDQVRDLTHGVGYVARTTGFSPAEVAAHYVRFFAPTESVYGWGRWLLDDGQAFTFVSSPSGALDLVPVAGATLSHRGKHTPVLYVEQDEVPAATATYVMSVNPGPFQGVQEAPQFMHGFILGNEGVVTLPVQIKLDALLTRGELDLCQVHGHLKFGAMRNHWNGSHPLGLGGLSPGREPVRGSRRPCGRLRRL